MRHACNRVIEFVRTRDRDRLLIESETGCFYCEGIDDDAYEDKNKTVPDAGLECNERVRVAGHFELRGRSAARS